MWMPLAALAVFAALLGFLGTPFIGNNLWHHYLAPSEHAHPFSMMVMGIATGAAALGWFLSRAIYRKQAVLADGSDPLQARLGVIWTLLKNKWYVDEFYDATIIRLNWMLASFFRGVDAVVDGVLHGIVWVTWGISQLFRWVGDEFIINGGVDVLSDGVRGTGGAFSKVQNGQVQKYMRLVGWGTVALFVLLLLLMSKTNLLAAPLK